ncbi:dual specificity protein kinase TTK-like [Portunus trituberculatus]|uniref:dual specificity protein kinase TTK-like n=1 Tax=Portunus trituberculatus TaxID=210409 RepID=UPI001E1CF182|nr:dual specificity protein kinase TTK-like [Portunus trituberculatus]
MDTPRPLPAPSHQPQPHPHPQPPPTPLPPPASNSLVVNGKIYQKLRLLGRGGSCKVHAVFDEESGEMRAVKVVNLEGVDQETINSYRNEVAILKKLQGCSRVIQLFDFEDSPTHLSLVMEKGSKDFASILSECRSGGGAPIPYFTIQYYWQGMLRAVHQIHGHGIIHCDLKPANFLIVDNTVKLIDFGIASSVPKDMTSVVKDSQAGTFNYMSPESLQDIERGSIVCNPVKGKPAIKIRVKSDVWSLGCILYNFVHGRTPFQHITNVITKLATISNPNTVITIPPTKHPHLDDVLRACLQHDPLKRPSIEELLAHPMLTE